MSDIIVEETGLPLRFPDPREEAYARAEEFRKLSPEARWREITALMEWGLNMVHFSPRREAIEQSWRAQEEESRRIQQELMVQHGK